MSYPTDLPRCPHPSRSIGKKTYRSAAKAKQAIIDIGGAHGKLYPYQCPACGRWHLTHRPQGTRLELIDGAIIVIEKPADQVERDIAAAKAGDHTHIRWATQHTPRPIPVQRIRGVIRDQAA